MPPASRRNHHDQASGSAPAGAAYRPAEPIEESEPARQGKAAVRSVSHGHPLSPSEFRKLKERASRVGRPRAATAQKDPAASDRDDEE